ncbi:3'-5' exonuclease [Actinoallomurus sp. NPDC052308]|uniref:3'-5' exonuclease n=1 Tax=Actinoallomurus sp. NPDC052308 TaxID=3155530 RepID=UPI00342F7B02
MQGYAIVDVETTGLYAGGTDRIIEVAVVQLDPLGRATGEWATLINPQRDLGPTGIHGIRANDVRQAPSFAAIAPTLAQLLASRVTVAHNLPFDARFLAAEYARLGVTTPLDHRHGLCTMRMAAEFLPGSKRALAACCQAAGVALDNQHDALNDARAAAGLLSCYLGKVGTPPPWEDLLWRVAALTWPALPPFLRRSGPPRLRLRDPERLPRSPGRAAAAVLRRRRRLLPRPPGEWRAWRSALA